MNSLGLAATGGRLTRGTWPSIVRGKSRGKCPSALRLRGDSARNSWLLERLGGPGERSSRLSSRLEPRSEDGSVVVVIAATVWLRGFLTSGSRCGAMLGGLATVATRF